MNWEACRSFWPNARHSRFVATRPHVWHAQEAGAGRCLLLLHGAGASTHSWRDVFPDLARDFRVVAVDLPGQGFTRLGARSRCGLNAMSADLAALLAGQGIVPHAIIGHSAGGAIALRLALGLPEPPKAVICVNGALGDFRGPARKIFPALAQVLALTPLSASLFSRMAASPGRVRGIIESTGSTIDAVGLDLYRRLVADSGHVDATLCMMAQWTVAGLTADLPSLRVPSLFLAGSNDRAVPPETSIRAAAMITGSRVEELPGLGHLLHEEAPDLAAEAIRRFLG